MRRLIAELNAAYREKIKIYNPKNCQIVKFNLLAHKNAKILGSLAKDVLRKAEVLHQQKAIAKPGADLPLMNEIAQGSEDVQMEDEEDLSNYVEVDIDGIFVKHDFEHVILKEDEVEKFTQNKLTFSRMRQTLFVPFPYDIQVLLYYLSSRFPRVDVINEDEAKSTIADGQTSTEQKPDIRFKISGTSEELSVLRG